MNLLFTSSPRAYTLPVAGDSFLRTSEKSASFRLSLRLRGGIDFDPANKHDPHIWPESPLFGTFSPHLVGAIEGGIELINFYCPARLAEGRLRMSWMQLRL